MLDAARDNNNEFLYQDLTISPRRNTEPDTHLRQKDSGLPASLHPYLHRGITYDRWSDQHRRLAALKPMVEYLSADDVPERGQIPAEPRKKPASYMEMEDEEAPMTIPAGYHYKGHIQGCSCAKIVGGQTRNDVAETSILPRSGSDHQCDMVHKIAAFVLTKAGAQQQPNDKTKCLIEDLAAQILEAVKTDSWDHIPKELLREVRTALKRV